MLYFGLFVLLIAGLWAKGYGPDWVLRSYAPRPMRTLDRRPLRIPSPRRCRGFLSPPRRK